MPPGRLTAIRNKYALALLQVEQLATNWGAHRGRPKSHISNIFLNKTASLASRSFSALFVATMASQSSRAAPGFQELGTVQPSMARQEETSVRLRCPICLEGIWPCETVQISFCHPVHHVVHENCWWDQTDEQQKRCSICRQRELSRPTAFMLYGRFPANGLTLSFEDLCGEPSMRWFSPTGQGLIQDFVQGELTEAELIRIAHSARRRPNVGNAINTFITESRKKPRT